MSKNRKKKTIRKHELREKIRMQQLTINSLNGELYSTASDIWEDLEKKAYGTEPHEIRKNFLAMTRDVSLWLWLFLKSQISEFRFKYSSDRIIYFGTDEEFEKRFGKGPDFDELSDGLFDDS
tara:strand:+ start:393 stop:758 length:366 start_codon:yes stop_codon:yes gene_type:complete